jgi:cytoplasmic iron level regulating protein YaaA (DUF328/UPF0246 family)
VLIILPPSETKRPPTGRAAPVDVDGLSFPALAPLRHRILDALIQTSAGPDALRRLLGGPSLVDEVVRNLRLREMPARPALDVYSGVLYEGLEAATLSPAARRRAARSLIVSSALWGALRPSDRIPPYRMHICARLEGMDRLEPTWRTAIPAVLAEAAGSRGVILDLRSGSYTAMGRPAGMGDRTAAIRVVMEKDGRNAPDWSLKHVRGEAARYLLESGASPANPTALASLLAARWPVTIDPPAKTDGPWTLTLAIPG